METKRVELGAIECRRDKGCAVDRGRLTSLLGMGRKLANSQQRQKDTGHA